MWNESVQLIRRGGQKFDVDVDDDNYHERKIWNVLEDSEIKIYCINTEVKFGQIVCGEIDVSA